MPTTSGPLRGRVEALAERLSQTAETVTRSSRIFVENSAVDDINPPEDIDEYHDLYRELGIIRANYNQFVTDVVKPGVRVTAEDDTTEAFFTGGEGAPDFAPRGGFLDNCAVMAEKQMPFLPFLEVTIIQRRTRGTALIEKTKPDGQEDQPDAPITGFKHIRPETVSARTHANTNILLDPEDTDAADEITPRGEAAAWVQYDDQSIVGRRAGGIDKTEIPLSQHDVIRQVYNPDIGGADPEDGVFGVSELAAVAEDAEEYRDIKRDRALAVKKKAWGIYSAQFNTEVVEAGDEIILTEWDGDEQDEWVNDVGDLGPGDIIGHDGSIDLEKWESEVPDLGETLQHYVDDILAPLPAPKYATAHGEQITQHVTDRQENAYHDTIQAERQYQARVWTQAFRDVAERHPNLDPAGLDVTIEPEESDSPALSLSDEEVDRIQAFATAFDEATGTIPADSIVDLQAFLELVFDIPEDVFADVADERVDESSEQVRQMAEELPGEMGAETDD